MNRSFLVWWSSAFFAKRYQPSFSQDKPGRPAEECFIELPKSMRKLGDEDNDDNDIGVNEREAIVGMPMIKKDNIKEKFNQLRKLDGTAELFDVRPKY